MSIRLHIERLVIDDIGFDPGQAYRLKSALEADLTQRLQAGGLEYVTRSDQLHRPVNGGSFTPGEPLTARTLGRQIGHAVFRSIRK